MLVGDVDHVPSGTRIDTVGSVACAAGGDPVVAALAEQAVAVTASDETVVATSAVEAVAAEGAD